MSIRIGYAVSVTSVLMPGCPSSSSSGVVCIRRPTAAYSMVALGTSCRVRSPLRPSSLTITHHLYQPPAPSLPLKPDLPADQRDMLWDRRAVYSQTECRFPDLSGYRLRYAIPQVQCPSCQNVVMTLVRCENNGACGETTVYPLSRQRTPVPPDVPATIKAEYGEATVILPLSHSATPFLL